MVAVKKIMMSIGVAALVITSTSVMAQSYQPEVGSGNIVRKEGGPVTSQRFGAPFADAYAYAYAKPAPHHRQVSHERMERQ